jgi:hypothetical protein
MQRLLAVLMISARMSCIVAWVRKDYICANALEEPLKRLAVLLCAALSGCILVNQQTATTAKTALVGKSRSAILACLGAPDQVFSDGGTEYLSYYGAGNVRSHGNVFVNSSGGFYSGSSRQAKCIVNFAVRDGRVASVNYRSSGGAITAPDEACGIVVHGCM